VFNNTYVRVVDNYYGSSDEIIECGHGLLYTMRNHPHASIFSFYNKNNPNPAFMILGTEDDFTEDDL
jgi:hypothetical protein